MEQKKIKVLIADDSAEYGVACASELRTHNFYVITRRKDGKAVLDSILKDQPDVVVMDAVMPNMDAIEILEKSQKFQKRPLFIVTSSYENEFMQQQIMENGAAYFIMKPFEVSVLANRILSLVNHATVGNNVTEKESLEILITDTMHKLGVPARLKGYYYLRTAILAAVDDQTLLDSVTKRLYPEIARKHHTTPTRVERAIRHAIDVAWEQGNLELMDSYFSHTTHNSKGKPSNSEFIAMLADDFRLKYRFV